jgi:hypothetical protein
METVLEKLGTTESTTISVSREANGKIRLTSLLWPEPKVILRNEVLEIRNVEGRLHLARKIRSHDEWDPKVEPYDPYGSDPQPAAQDDGNFDEDLDAVIGGVDVV